MTSDHPNPSNSDDTSEDRLKQSLEEMRRVSEQRDREDAERQRKREEEIAANRAIVADKSLNIDEAQYQRAIELAQILANRRYRDIPLWIVTARRQVGCIADDNDIELVRAATANISTIEIRAEFGRCRFSVEEAEAIVSVLLNPQGAVLNQSDIDWANKIIDEKEKQ